MKNAKIKIDCVIFIEDKQCKFEIDLKAKLKVQGKC